MINAGRKHTGYSDYDYVTSNEEKPIVYAVSGALIAACFFFALSRAYQSCIPVSSGAAFWLTVLGMAASGAFTFLLQLKKLPKSVAAVALVPILAVVATAGPKRLYGGIMGIINCHIELWNACYDDGKALFKSPLISDFGINAVTVIVAVICVTVIIRLLKNRNAVGTLLIITICFLPSLILDRFDAVAFSLAITTLCAIIMERMKSADVIRRIQAILLFGIIAVIFAFGITNTHSQSIDNFKQTQKQIVSAVRFGEDSLPEGDLTKASDMLSGNEERLIVTSEYGRDLYLRGFIGAEYKDGKWEELKNSSYGSGNSSIVNWLEERGFTAQQQYNSYAVNNETALDTNSITVENIGAKRSYIYLPYSASGFSKQHSYLHGDSNTKSSALFGASSYDFIEQSDRRPTELYTLENWYSSPETKQEEEYVKNETVYRKFVYENYLSADDKNGKKIYSYFWSNADENEKKNLLSATEHIRDTLEKNCTYSENCEYVKQSGDPIGDFLFTYKSGNSALFASAAVQALRSIGFPARYAEGYYLSNSENPEATVTLTTKNAHAWAEVYMDGIGWLPVDFTPGFYYDTYALVSLVDAPSQSKKISGDQNGDSSGAHNLSADKTDIKRTKTAEEKKHDVYVIIGILTALFSATVIILTLIEVCKIIKVSRLRKTIEKAQPKQRQEYICKVILSLLVLDSIPVTLGRNADETAEAIEQKHPEISKEEYLRVNGIIEKFKYAEITLEAYEEQILTSFLEKYLSLTEKKYIKRIHLLSKINIKAK